MINYCEHYSVNALNTSNWHLLPSLKRKAQTNQLSNHSVVNDGNLLFISLASSFQPVVCRQH